MWKLVFTVICTLIMFLLSYNVGMLNSSAGQPAVQVMCPKTTKAVVQEAIAHEEAHAEDSAAIKPLKSSLFHNDGNFALTDIFSSIHHPSSVNKNELYFVNGVARWPQDHHKSVNQSCKEVFLTRAGSRANQPNKCTALVTVEHGRESAQQISNRWGHTAKLTDQNQNDYSRDYSRKEETVLLPPLLQDLPSLKKSFLEEMGPPVNAITGKRRTAIIMVANDGVMDLVLNFICSAKKSKIDLHDVMVFVDGEQNANLIQSMGGHAMYAESLGSMPHKAAGGYLDKTFSRMMWFKMTAVYLAQAAGFNLLFQDADLVWMKDPIPWLENINEDVAFMDDGARTPRYTPFFTNSGFYYMKWNRKTLYFHEKMLKHAASEIGYTHSHQSVLIRHLVESHHLVGLQVLVLDQKDFPSGQMYHHNKKYMATIRDGSFTPYVFHMCWTANRSDKVKYFKELGFWYIPDTKECTNAPYMQAWVTKNRKKAIAQNCCRL
jgi:hypothetical protein